MRKTIAILVVSGSLVASCQSDGGESEGSELVGVHHFTIPSNFGAGFGIIQFYDDGSFEYGNIYDYRSEILEPTARGEWWVEDEVFHIVDAESRIGGWGWECQPGVEGTYTVLPVGEGQMTFKTIDEPCDVPEESTGWPSRELHLAFLWKLGPPPEEDFIPPS